MYFKSLGIEIGQRFSTAGYNLPRTDILVVLEESTQPTLLMRDQ